MSKPVFDAAFIDASLKRLAAIEEMFDQVIDLVASAVADPASRLVALPEVVARARLCTGLISNMRAIMAIRRTLMEPAEPAGKSQKMIAGIAGSLDKAQKSSAALKRELASSASVPA